ncbi:MAG: ABC transporter permease, partial [Chloroflexi bacterium]|nr:ABC transporter permease [Chloroflexota bacterium]
GSMISDGRDYLGSAWWVAFFPGIAIVLTVPALNFIGDWLRDRWDPKLRQIS